MGFVAALRRRFRMLGILLILAPWVMGLGGGNSASDAPIPIPAKNFNVTVTDAKGQQAKAERFTWEGKVHFQGQYGSATITIPFQKVQSIKVIPAQANIPPTQVLTKVTLRGGDTLDLTLDRSSKCYGATSFGNYEIFLKDIGEIQFE